jgi:hypothetical protein
MAWLRLNGWRRAGAAIVALLALTVRLAAPTGWMLAPGDGHAAPRLVICTGHGPADLSGRPLGPSHAPGRSIEHPCVFAGAATPPAPQAPAVPLATPTPVAADVPVVAFRDQRPGRGLAAPPPPSHAPPSTPDQA